MDFFAHQEAALRASRWLIVLFLIAVAAVLASINALFAFLLDASNLELHLWVTLGTLVVMAGGALFSLLGFAGSGRSVAEALGGREVDPETRDPDERRLLHVVEEMAIASGVPRPPVYILDEEGINAFAAGYRIDDAAIGVTKGLLALPRDQIQGVIAHEYSHILHGDMRLNMRLIAVLAGLMAVAGVGRFLMQAALRSAAAASSNRRSSGALPFLLLGLAIFVIGLLGWFFGRLIQAAISRRREYLADASAVQYTRNPEGIAGALEHILRRGSAVSAERAADAAHLFFAQALSGLFATHPPLAERIARIRGRPVEGPASTAAVGAAPAGHGALAPAQLVASAGALDRQQLNRAERVLAQLPPAVVEAAHQPFSARAVALLPLLARREAPRERQLAAVARHDPALAAELRRLWPHWSQADATAVRWPLLQLVLPLLGSLSLGQRRQLLAVAEALATDDGIVTVAEYIVLRRLQRALQPTPDPGTLRLAEAAREVAVLLAHVIRTAKPEALMRSFAVGWQQLRLPGPTPSLPVVPDYAACSAALDRLQGLSIGDKRRLLEAAAHAVAADGIVRAEELELLRLLAAEFAVPLPLPELLSAQAAAIDARASDQK